MILRRLATKAILCLTLIGTATAHHMYIMPERFHVSTLENVAARIGVGDQISVWTAETFRPETITIGLHMDGERHEAAAHSAGGFPQSQIRPGRLSNTVLYSAMGSTPIRNLKNDGKRITARVRIPSPGHYIVAAVSGPAIPIRTGGRRFGMPANEFNDYLEEEGLTEAMDWRALHGELKSGGIETYTKYSKAILIAGAPNGVFNQVVGHELEIVPDNDPYTLKPGESMNVRVLLRGAPIGGLQLTATWNEKKSTRSQPIGRTDSQGRIAVPLTSTGSWRFHTIYMERCTDQKIADWESFWATLTFEIRN